MFYHSEVKGHIRVPPDLFQEDTEKAILDSLNKSFEGFISKDIGIVVGVAGIKSIGDGIIVPGDGAAYYETIFSLYVFKPEVQEVILGKIIEIVDFGAFINTGAVDGMIHISQTMDDFVSYNKSGSLSGKESKKVLKVGDNCRARIVAVSFREADNPKIGLTMRQQGLGKLEDIRKEIEAREKKKNA